MKNLWLATGLGLLALIAFLTYLSFSHGVGSPRGTTRLILHYRDPMHPSYTSRKPGKAPDCGMDLEPVYTNENIVVQSPMPEAPRGVVRINREQQQLIGVLLGRVETSSTIRTVRTLGRVASDETRVFPVIAGAEGWVTRIFSGGTGSIVQKGQPLVAVYGREYTTAQRTFLYALRALENLPRAPPGDYQDQPALTLQEARLNVENMGIGEAQIQQLMSARQVTLNITLTAPAAGVVVARNVFPQQRFERGTELFRIADLSHVWIIADLLGEEARHVKGGLTAQVFLPGRPEKAHLAMVSEALSTFDAASRSLKVRLETENPDLILRPGMFVDLEFRVPLPPAATVPATALHESGVDKIVFVERGQGVFEPRSVKIGWRLGDRVEIIHGLELGESIVISGNFLLGSESRMQQAAARPND